MMKDNVDNMHESRMTLQNNVFFIIACVCFLFLTKTDQLFSGYGVERALCSPCKERRGETNFCQNTVAVIA